MRCEGFPKNKSFMKRDINIALTLCNTIRKGEDRGGRNQQKERKLVSHTHFHNRALCRLLSKWQSKKEGLL